MRARTEPRDTPMMATGIAFASGGFGALITGLALFGASGGCPNYYSSSCFPAVVGNALMPAGLVVMLLGVPFWLYGAEQVPVSGEPAFAPAIALSLGAGELTLRLRL